MNEIYDYRSERSRVQTVGFLGRYAREYRAEVDAKWETFYAYYRGEHRTAEEIAQSCRDSAIPWIAAQSPDPFFQIESQLYAEIPDFELRGRDDDLDSEKAKQREKVVRYILERSCVADQAVQNERTCLITGTSAWKVFWDGNGEDGDIKVLSIDPRHLFPDPSAKTLEDCEFIQYVYPMHIRAFLRTFGAEIAKRHLNTTNFIKEQDPFDMPNAHTYQAGDDTVSVCEHWYRDDDGDICCSIQAGGYELRHIVKYWRTTARLNNCYPFVIKYRTANPDGFWGTGDIEPIMTLVDAVDRELSIAQLSSAFSGSDVILAEYDAFSEEPENRPGAIWRLKPGSSGKVSRLGGLGNNSNRLEMTSSLRSLISETLGTLDVDRGLIGSNFSSASALQQLIERNEERNSAKKHERLSAYKRLFQLIDWTAVEFYDRDRVIFLGAGEGKDSIVFTFNSGNLYDKSGCIPYVDTIVAANEKRTMGSTAVLETINAVLSHGVSRENYPLVEALVRTIDIHLASDLHEYFEKLFSDELLCGEKEMGETAEQGDL